jgi:hypothetical protein
MSPIALGYILVVEVETIGKECKRSRGCGVYLVITSMSNAEIVTGAVEKSEERRTVAAAARRSRRKRGGSGGGVGIVVILEMAE